MKVFLCLLTLLISFRAMACEDLNLYENHSILDELPLTNQGDVNICYAHALTTVYNMEFGQRSGQRPHPFWVAYVHKIKGLHWQPQRLDYSVASLAWSDLKKNGFCDPEILQKDLETLKQGSTYSDSQLFYLLGQFFKVKNFRTYQTPDNFESTIDELMLKLQKNSPDAFEIPWNRNDVFRIIKSIKEETRTLGQLAWMDQHLMKNCRAAASHFPDQEFISTARQKESNVDLAQLIQEKLIKNKPLTVGFCYRIFKEPTQSFPSSPRIIKAAHPNCGAHYAVIVGSRKKAESCEYLIRNSFGSGFWGHENYSCLCRNKITGISSECRKSSPLSPGQEVLGCWIERHKLLDSTFDLSYFQ